MIERRNAGVPLKILIVEDEVMIAMDLRRILRKANYEVVGPVGTVASALAVLQGNIRMHAFSIMDFAQKQANPLQNCSVSRMCLSFSPLRTKRICWSGNRPSRAYSTLASHWRRKNSSQSYIQSYGLSKMCGRFTNDMT